VAAIPVSAQTYTVVYNFGSHANDPVDLIGGPNLIARGRDGNLYSLSNQGGTDIRGTAFKFTPAGVVTLLDSFAFTNRLYPIGGLTRVPMETSMAQPSRAAGLIQSWRWLRTRAQAHILREAWDLQSPDATKPGWLARLFLLWNRFVRSCFDRRPRMSKTGGL
jgi:hypothetical protein